MGWWSKGPEFKPQYCKKTKNKKRKTKKTNEEWAGHMRLFLKDSEDFGMYFVLIWAMYEEPLRQKVRRASCPPHTCPPHRWMPTHSIHRTCLSVTCCAFLSQCCWLQDLFYNRLERLQVEGSLEAHGPPRSLWCSAACQLNCPSFLGCHYLGAEALLMCAYIFTLLVMDALYISFSDTKGWVLVGHSGRQRGWTCQGAVLEEESQGQLGRLW
jgi:hypothetical protein